MYSEAKICANNNAFSRYENGCYNTKEKALEHLYEFSHGNVFKHHCVSKTQYYNLL